uniref:type I protein arginine methyltransferase n=2 Tax=Clastoptera arizonana TaxID=38151 RepID=A0A1B6C1N1_9HEMI
MTETNQEDTYNMEDEDDDDWDGYDGWDEPTEESSALISCLFCDRKTRNLDDNIKHCANSHSFDLANLKARFKMDCYSYIKMVNFIRKNKCKPEVILSCKSPIWMDESYMKPVIADDAWLCYDFEDVEVPHDSTNSGGSSSGGGFHVNAEDGKVTLSELHFAELQRTIQSLTAQVREKQELVDRMKADMTQMQTTVSKIVNSNEGEVSNVERNVATIKIHEDRGYFNTYAHFGIHLEMLSDEVRTLSYRDALQRNGGLLHNRLVLDLGCGTGILAMFAASAGADKVIAIDQSDIIYHTMDIIRENNLKNKITLIKGRIEDTEIYVKKVDIIVSEWMGYFLFFEAMIDSVIFARDHYLAPGGILMPNRCSINLVGCSLPERHKELVGFWSDVYGYKMSCLRTEVIREPSVEVVHPDSIVTSASTLSELELMTVTTQCLDFKSSFSLVVTKDCDLTALVGFFDVFFDLPAPVAFSTGPFAKPTHWKQTVFLLKQPLRVMRGEVIEGELACQRDQKDVRSLKVTITIASRVQDYYLC